MRAFLGLVFLACVILNATPAVARDPGLTENISASMLGSEPATEAPAPVLAAPEAPAPGRSLGEWLVLIGGGATALSLFLRGLAEMLYWIAARTKTDTDNNIALMVSNAAELLARVPAMLGWGMPKATVIAKAEKLGMVKANDA